ncbi:LysR family transcriptional regulator [Boseongicola sp. H5]|uniref:LysR family transcriptional regulator n=1 Tax=Boseongicola sp. H5 TaxID=2763261 RepID=UPI001D09FA87|nr:LysR family transcriptional regulator [Boseongicola sp. H5]
MADLDTRHLKALVAVNKHGSITAAAQEIGVTQPALSATIRQAEARIGVTLIDRGPRHATPTAAGALMIQDAQRILSDLARASEAMRDLAAGRAGQLSMAALPSAAAEIVAPVLARFHDAHPTIRIAVRDALNQEVIALVRSGEVDFGLGIPGDECDDLMTEPLVDDQFVLVAPADHPLADRDEVRWDALRGLSRIEAAPGSNTRESVSAILGPPSDGTAIECSVVPTAIGLIRQGLGIGVLSEMACRPFCADPGLAFRPLLPTATRSIAVIRQGHRAPSPSAKLFLARLTG